MKDLRKALNNLAEEFVDTSWRTTITFINATFDERSEEAYGNAQQKDVCLFLDMERRVVNEVEVGYNLLDDESNYSTERFTLVDFLKSSYYKSLRVCKALDILEATNGYA